MWVLRSLVGTLVLLLPLAGAMGQSLSTSERLELLERRAALITDLTLQLDEMRRENRQLRGEVESLRYEIDQLKRKQRDLYLDIDQRLSGLPSQGASPAPTPIDKAPVTEAGRPSRAPTEPARPPAGGANRAQVQAEYQAAYALLSPQQRRYGEAAAAFEAFIQKYPDDELAPNAKYWLGEAYYVSQKNQPALKAFERVVNEHPGSRKAPGALFKIGRLKEASGDRAGARTAYRRVLQDFPDAPAAGLSRQRLKQLGG